jgi:hypothetical protein
MGNNVPQRDLLCNCCLSGLGSKLYLLGEMFALLQAHTAVCGWVCGHCGDSGCEYRWTLNVK